MNGEVDALWGGRNKGEGIKVIKRECDKMSRVE